MPPVFLPFLSSPLLLSSSYYVEWRLMVMVAGKKIWIQHPNMFNNVFHQIYHTLQEKTRTVWYCEVRSLLC